MKSLLIVLFAALMLCAEEFKNIKYEIVASNDKYITVLIEDAGTANAQTYIDYIVAAEKEYSIEFVCVLSAQALIFKKTNIVKK